MISKSYEEKQQKIVMKSNMYTYIYGYQFGWSLQTTELFKQRTKSNVLAPAAAEPLEHLKLTEKEEQSGRNQEYWKKVIFIAVLPDLAL